VSVWDGAELETGGGLSLDEELEEFGGGVSDVEPGPAAVVVDGAADEAGGAGWLVLPAVVERAGVFERCADLLPPGVVGVFWTSVAAILEDASATVTAIVARRSPA
jgi:hypothetical protein